MSTAVASSALFAEVQTRPDAPFGSLFLRVTFTLETDFRWIDQDSTSRNGETSNDGTSRLVQSMQMEIDLQYPQRIDILSNLQ